MKKVVCAMFIMFLFSGTAVVFSDDSSLDLKLMNDDFKLTFKFQYRVRFEYIEGRDLMENTSGGYFSHRARFGLMTNYKDFLKLHFDVQDVRVWGEEENTLFDYSADGLDMHQAYVKIYMPNKKCMFKVGRQEIIFDDHRLMGNVDWAQQARSFDAVAYKHKNDKWGVFVAYAKLREADIENFDETEDLYDSELPMAHVYFNPVENGYLSFTFIHEMFENLDGRERTTIGPYFTYDHNGFHVGIEGYYQFGQNDSTMDYAAYMAAFRAGYSFDTRSKPSLSFRYEYLSGDDDPGDDEFNTFNTLYATNHKFYGYMDFFLNIPADTFGLGLQDIAISGTCRPHDKLKAAIDVHYFLSAENSPEGNDDWGTEVDLTLKTFLDRVFTLTAGFSVFLPGDAIEELRGGSDNEYFAYIMSDVKF